MRTKDTLTKEVILLAMAFHEPRKDVDKLDEQMAEHLAELITKVFKEGN